MLQFFTYAHMDIFDTCILSKVFHNCYLPDAASGLIVLSYIIALFPAICVVGEDDEFVLIDIHDEFSETLHSYAMTKNTFWCFHIIYIYNMYSYILIYL